MGSSKPGNVAFSWDESRSIREVLLEATRTEARRRVNACVDSIGVERILGLLSDQTRYTE